MDKKKLALVHIIKKELGLADDEYRRILRAAAGVDSSRDLTEEGFTRLMRYFVRSGYYVVNRHGLTIRQKMFIDHLQRELEWTDEHLAHFLHKYYGKTKITALTRREAIKVIESLKHIRLHQKVPGPAQEDLPLI